MNGLKHSLVICMISMIMMVLPGLVSLSFAQSTLMTESFENGGGTPPGWTIETVTPGNTVTFVTSTSWPSGYSAFNGTYFAKFNSFEASGGVVRLKNTVPVSTIGYTNVAVDFAWLESSGYAGFLDRVEVQWSTDGSTWATAGTFNRYNAVQGWKIKNQVLPVGAYNQPAVYIAFLFTSAYGNDCYLDFTHITATGPPVPTTITVGAGMESCNYPYTTYWMGGRTQLIYTAAQLYAAGAMPGQISKLGFNVYANSAQPMVNFNINMMNSALSVLPGWVTGMQNCYSGTYSVGGIGWQMITLQTPFIWTGDNIILEVCFGSNGTFSSYSYVYGTTAPAGQIEPYWMDNIAGCEYTGASYTGFTALPNLRFTEIGYAGTLSGVVTSCYNGVALSGVTVTCGSVSGTTNASGAYVLNNIPTGTYNVTYTNPGFLPGNISGVTIATGQSIIKNLCLNPIPAYLSGVVTSAATGNPIIGAKITAGTSFGYSTGPNGAYTVSVYPFGALSVSCTKAGFDNSYAGPFTFTQNNTITQNFALLENVNAPGSVTATLNPGQTAINLTWSPPNGNYELLYDDGTENAFQIWAYSGSFNAVKFTPPGYPCTISGATINIGKQTDYMEGSNPFVPCQFLVYDATGPGGSPGTQIAGPFFFTPSSYEWNLFTFPTPVSVAAGSFYLVHQQGGNNPNAAGIAIDATNNQLRSFMKFMPGGGWVSAPGNFMIRSLMYGPGGPSPLMMLKPDGDSTNSVQEDMNPGGKGTTVSSDGLNPSLTDDSTANGDNANIVTGYQVWRLLRGEEGSQGSWISVATTATQTAVDNSWPALPCNVYRWAVKTQYTGNRWSSPTFSNFSGKCVTAPVTINVGFSCYGASSIYTNVKLQNTTYADTVYQATMESGGTCTFPRVWKGTYTLTVSKFGYNTYTQGPVTVSDNLTLNVTLLQIKTPPTNLQINNQSLQATWSPPRMALPVFAEDWNSGSFITQYWSAGGANWAISVAFGNPAPSVLFNYMPRIFNYNQYLTSADIVGQHTPALSLQYDIYLSNFINPNTNFMSVEIWNGSSWVVLKTYSTAVGAIPWTHETVDVSAYSNSIFKIRFHASGIDSWSINNWGFDNIALVANGEFPDPCLEGYLFYLNNALTGIAYDTSYVIPSSLTAYGQSFTGCVSALYGSGTSSQVCHPFTSYFLCPPTNLTVVPIGNAASLSWVKPLCPAPVLKSSGETGPLSGSSDPESDSPLTEAGLTGYDVYRSQAGTGGPWSQIHHITNPDVLTATDMNLSAGNLWYKVVAYYDLTSYGFPGQTGQSWHSGPVMLNIPALPVNTTIQNITVGNGLTTCISASGTITIAGSNTSFTVQNGGNATMVAGQKILYLPHTLVNAGGYMHGYITTNGSYCVARSPTLLSVTETETNPSFTEPAPFFRVYPNPTRGKFILEFNDPLDFARGRVEIYDMMGARILIKELSGEKKYELSLADQAVGVYFVRVLSGGVSKSVKIIRQ